MTARRISVWAPAATAVGVVADDDSCPMEESGGGWFAANADLRVGDDYAFSVDGSDPMPDPRSRSQPGGVHGPSRLVAHPRRRAVEPWRGFPSSDAIIYELHVGTFTRRGTFDAAITRLGHLQELGVNADRDHAGRRVSRAAGWGYDGVDLFAPHHAYGGPEGLHRLVDASTRTASR